MAHRILAALVLAASLTTSTASAQDRPAVTLSPADPARWDVAFHAGWMGSNKSEIALDWDEWYQAASFDASAGYSWTPNLKLDVDLGTTTRGGIYRQDVVFAPPAPTYVETREHLFRTTSLAGGLTYQFFDNRLFHPFVTAGVVGVHEEERTTVSYPIPRLGPGSPGPATSGSTNVFLHPFAAVGFKAYATDRLFFRTDLRVTGSTRQVESVGWRAGFGFDF